MDPKYKLSPQAVRLILAVTILILILYGTSVSMAFADNRGIEAFGLNGTDVYLPDLGHDTIDDMFGRNWDTTGSANDFVLGILMIGTFFYVVITQKGRRLEIYTRWALTIAVIFLIRDIAVFSTVSPWARHYNLTHSCKHWPNVAAAPYEMVFHSRRTCFDTFFSGHTANAVVCCMIITIFQLPRKFKLISYALIFISWSLCILTILYILHLQVHYTIDVEIGFIFGIIFFLLIDYQIQLKTGFFSWWELDCAHYSNDHAYDPKATGTIDFYSSSTKRQQQRQQQQQRGDEQQILNNSQQNRQSNESDSSQHDHVIQIVPYNENNYVNNNNDNNNDRSNHEESLEIN